MERQETQETEDGHRTPETASRTKNKQHKEQTTEGRVLKYFMRVTPIQCDNLLKLKI